MIVTVQYISLICLIVPLEKKPFWVCLWFGMLWYCGPDDRDECTCTDTVTTVYFTHPLDPLNYWRWILDPLLQTKRKNQQFVLEYVKRLLCNSCKSFLNNLFHSRAVQHASTFFKIWRWTDGSWDSNLRQWICDQKLTSHIIQAFSNHVHSGVTSDDVMIMSINLNVQCG